MPTLLDKIKADAAAWLPLPDNRLPAQEPSRSNPFLKVQIRRLKIRHRRWGGRRAHYLGLVCVLHWPPRYVIDAAAISHARSQRA
mgnify:CR=1 FL=1